MEMDKTLKILLACLGVVGIAVLAIPQGDPLANSAPAPATPAAPTTQTADPNAPQAANAAQNNANAVPGYVPPASDQTPKPTADSATIQQQNFGQPMIDPRPLSEQRTAPNYSEGPPPPNPVIQPNYGPGNGSGQPGYAPPPSPPNFGSAPNNSLPTYNGPSAE
jgi:hypothetical protein